MKSRTVAAACALAAGLTALGGPAFAGEVNGNQQPIPATTVSRSICSFSGQNNFNEPTEPGRTQSYGQLVKMGLKAQFPSPGVACPVMLRGFAYVGMIQADGSTAMMSGNYKCSGGTGVLWASIKQGGSTAQRMEGSAAKVASWYDVHVPLMCDGTLHSITVTVTKESSATNPYVTKTYRNLHSGDAYLQWCVADGMGHTGSYASWRDVHQRAL